MSRPIAYRPKEAAHELRVGKTTLYRWLKAGTIRSTKQGRVTLIPLSEIERVVGQSSAA